MDSAHHTLTLNDEDITIEEQLSEALGERVRVVWSFLGFGGSIIGTLHRTDVDLYTIVCEPKIHTRVYFRENHVYEVRRDVGDTKSFVKIVLS